MDNLLRRNGQASSRHNGAVLYMNTGGWVRTQVLAEHIGVSEDVITFVTRISGEKLFEGARLKVRETGKFKDNKMKWVRAGDRHCFDWVTLERTATRLNYKALSVLECLCYVTEGEKVADILSCGLRTRKLTGPVEDSHAYNSHTNSLHPYFPWEQEAGKSLPGDPADGMVTITFDLALSVDVGSLFLTSRGRVATRETMSPTWIDQVAVADKTAKFGCRVVFDVRLRDEQVADQSPPSGVPHPLRRRGEDTGLPHPDFLRELAVHDV